MPHLLTTSLVDSAHSAHFDWLSLIFTMSGFAFATSASPGPVNIISAMTGAQFGVHGSAAYVLGQPVVLSAYSPYWV